MPRPPRLPRHPRTPFATLIAATLLAAALVSAPRHASEVPALLVAEAAPHSPADAFEWPVAIASGSPEGSVWVGLAADVINWGGLFRYDRDLAPGPGWGLNGAPRTVSIGPGTGHLFADEPVDADPESFNKRVLARFRPNGRHHASWPAPADFVDFDAGRVAGGDGVFLLYEDPATDRERVLVMDQDGSPIGSWEAVRPLNTETASALASDPSGDVWVAFRHVFSGTVRRFSADGQSRGDRVLASVPLALDVDAAGSLFVASVSDLPDVNAVTRFNADGSLGVECRIENAATLLDVAAGPDAGFYLLLRRPSSPTDPRSGGHELRHYDASCALLASRREFGPLLGTPHPPTATAYGPATASATPTIASTVQATPTAPSTPSPAPTEPPTHTPGIPPSETPGPPPPPASATPTKQLPLPSPAPLSRTAFLPLAIAGLEMADIVQPPAILVIPEAIDPADWPADPVTIREARLEGSLLKLAVRFGGGCQPHDFGLVASSLFMESNPVQADLLLTHDAHGDMCRALLYRDLVFDLRPLRRAYEAAYPGSPGPIILRLRGWLDPLSYAW